MSLRGILDKHLTRFVSKKLLVWVISTIFYILSLVLTTSFSIPVAMLVTSDHWFMITMVWIGSQATLDMVDRWRNGRDAEQ